jgi:hypothetical protein
MFGGGGDSGGGVSTHKPKILPKTESQSTEEHTQILYDTAALQAMSDLTDKIGEMADYNQDFMKDVYMPMQEQFVQANTSMIPQMESIVGDSLEAMSADLVTNRTLGDMLSVRAQGDADPNSFVNRTFNAFQTEIANLPTEQERVGQALASVESQFQGAGKQLAKDFAARGQTVSQASARDLMMQKAQAKAGAAGLAKESARAERLGMLEKGVSVGQGKRAMDEKIAGQTTQGLLGLQQHQTGALGAKAGLFDPEAASEGYMSQQAALTAQQGILQRGTDAGANVLQHTQKGIKSAPEVMEDGTIKIGSKILKSDEYKELMDKYKDLDSLYKALGMGSGGTGSGDDGRGEFGYGADRRDARAMATAPRTMTPSERRSLDSMTTGGLVGAAMDALGIGRSTQGAGAAGDRGGDHDGGGGGFGGTGGAGGPGGRGDPGGSAAGSGAGEGHY